MIAPLKSAYLGELYGMAFFDCFIQRYTDSSKVPIFRVLRDVEGLTAHLLVEGLSALGEDVPERDVMMEEKGAADAQKWLHLPWKSLIDTMVLWVQPYQQRYQSDTDNATENLPLFTLVSDHENAIYEFLLAEQRGDITSVDSLTGFLERYRL